MFSLSARSQRHLQDVDSRLIAVVKRAIQIMRVDFGIPETGGFRTEVQQDALYQLGKSQIDGYSNKSKHQSGKAVDVFAYVDGKGSWDIGDLAQVATAMFAAAQELNVKIAWGGHWKKFIDGPHFELVEE